MASLSASAFPVPEQYQALVGRKFRDLGPSGLNRAYKIVSIRYVQSAQKRWRSPWVAIVEPYQWRPMFMVRHRSIKRFFQAGEYEEIT